MFIEFDCIKSILDKLAVMETDTDDIKTYRTIFIQKLRHEISHIPVYRVTVEQAKEIIDNMIFKKELGIDVTGIFKEMHDNISLEMVDYFIREGGDKWKLYAIKEYRKVRDVGLAEAKEYVERRAENLNKQTNSL